MEQCGSEVVADPAGCPSLPAGSAPPWQPAAFHQDAGQADVAGVAQQPESGSPADYHRILLKDPIVCGAQSNLVFHAERCLLPGGRAVWEDLGASVLH